MADSNRCQESGHVRENQELTFFVDPDLHPPPPPGGGGGAHIKRGGMLVVSLRGVNFGFCSQLGCSGRNARSPLGLRAKKCKSVYLLVHISSRR